MKNEWDLLALVQRQVAAGHTLLEFPYVTRGLVRRNGSPGRVRDAGGTEYEVGADFLPGVVPALRAHRISFTIDNGARVLSFGTKLRPQAPTHRRHGQETPIIDLTATGTFQLIDFRLGLPPEPTSEDEDE